MSTLSGVTQKGEKGKKFQSLDINSLYNHANKGESSEPHHQRNTTVRRHAGMQSLGKITTPRRPPANLPSLKAEHSGSDPSVSLVPSGGTGWGAKPGEMGPSPNSQPTPQQPSTTTPASTTPQPHGPNAPAAAGIGMPAPPPSIVPQTPAPQPPAVKTILGSTTTSGDKTWSSVTCGDAGPSFLAHQSPQFQQEFPSLSGEGAAQAHPGGGGGGSGKGGGGPDLQYGPGPPLRPQTEGSWIAGGGTARSAGSGAGGASVPSGGAILNPAISQHPPPYHPHPQDLVSGASSRSNLGPYGSAVGPVGLGSTSAPLSSGPTTASSGGPPVSQSSSAPNMTTVPAQFRNVLPNFLRKASGFSTIMPPTSSASSSNSTSSPNSSNFQNNVRPSRFNNQSDMNRNSRHADPEDIAPRPIIREEDLTRMDEISRDSGWAAQNDIDYNQKIAFSDDESTGVDDEKESSKEKMSAHNESESRNSAEKRETSDDERLTVDRQIGNTGPSHSNLTGDRLSNLSEQDRDQMWAARGPGAGGLSGDFRQHPRQSHSMMESEDLWSRKRRQNSEKMLQVAEKAKQRKEEEEKKFEESRARGIGSDSSSSSGKILKKGKDEEYDMRMPGWDKEDNLSGSGGGMQSKNDGPYFRQQMGPLMDGREGSQREFRGDRDRDYNRAGFNTPPRFQKQMQVAPPQGREPSGGYDANRWGPNRDGPVRRHAMQSVGGYMKGGQGQQNQQLRSGGRPPLSDMADIADNMSERLASKDTDAKGARPVNDDRDRRDRGEQEWEGRRGNNSSWDTSHYDDKSQRKENRKPSNEPFYKSHASPFSEDRDMDRQPKVDNRDRPDRPQRPDSRDSRASRDSKNSRDSLRDDKSVPDSNDFPWSLDLDKDLKDDKLRRRELNLKDEKRDIRREGHVPGPITKEKMSAYENKLLKTEKREIINSALINSVSEEDNRNSKSGGQPQPSLITSSDSWLEVQDMVGSSASSLSKENSLHSLPHMPSSDDIADKSSLLKDDQHYDKKKDGGQPRDKDGKNVRSRNERGSRGSDRQGGGSNRQGGQGGQGFNSNSSNFFFSRNSAGSAPYSRENDRRRSHGKGSFKDKLMSDSDGSLDEMSVSTESGKEDKRTDRRHAHRSSKSGERKKDKDERNHRETKKSDNDENFTSRKHGSGGSGGQGYDSVNHKEGFAPRGQPSRRGRGGGFRAAGRGSLGNVAGHYGPPGSKSPFPQNSSSMHDNRSAEEDDKMNDRSLEDGSLHHSDLDKSKNKSQLQGNMTGGNRQPKESRKGDMNKGKSARPKGDSAGEDRDSTSEGGSDSDMKKQTRNLRKTDKNKSNQRAAGEKRVPYNAAHLNGRPSRADDGKDNGFLEVKNKKLGKESRPLSRGQKEKGKPGAPGGQPGNAGSATVAGGGSQNKSNASSKSFHDKWINKPPRLQKLDNVRKQQQMGQQSDVSEMNKINQSSSSMFSSSIRDVNCSMAPAPVPAKSAWDKPITAALKSQSPTNALHLSSIGNSTEKIGMELPEHVQSGSNSQTSNSNAEKAMNAKLGREVVDKGLLDGATPPVQTIIFENQNYKFTLKPNQRIDKGRGKLDVDLDGATHGIAGLSFKTGVDLKPCDNKTQESLQMQMTFKNEDNADMKLDFFESDLSQLTEEKNIPRSIHLGQADLDEKIALVKKVWDTASSPMEQHQVVQHQMDDSGHVVPSSSSSSSFPPSFGGGVESALDHASAHQVDENTFNNADGYSQAMQSAGGYATGAGGMLKQDPTNPSGGVKPQPQQAAVMSSTIGAHSGQSLSSPPPVLNQPGHFGYQTQYSSIPTVPSPPAVIVNPQGGQVPTNTQDYVQQHGFPFSSHAIIGSQTPRSNYSQPTFNAYGLLNQSQTSFSQYIQTPPTGNAPPEMYPSMAPYRLQPSYGQSPSNPSTVLISSTSNTLMSASVKTTPQQPPPIGAIGTKGGYQNSQIQMSYMTAYEPHSLITANYLPPSPLVSQRHAGGNVTPGMQPSNSFFSGSTGAPGGFSSILGTNSQSMHGATAFSMQGFNNQTAAAPGSAPPSSNVVHPSYSSMGHFRTASPYMKQGVPGQHQQEASKSPSNNQDALSNSVFSNSGGGGQIPSPKSRSSGGSNSGSSKQMSVSPQQPSPTQSHKFSSYPPNLVQTQPPPNSQAGQQRSSSQLSSVQQRSNNGNGGASPLNNPQHLKYPPGPGPIQRPPPPYPNYTQAYVAQQQQQPQRQRIQQQHGPPPRTQQTHMKNYSFIQQGNQVKLETGMDAKNDQDKFLDGGSGSAKSEKEEVNASVDP